MSASEVVVTLPDGSRFVVAPPIPDGASEAIREGLARRALVATGDQCPCGAGIPRLNRAQRRQQARHGAVRIEIAHERDCPAVSMELELFLRRGVA